MRFVAKPSLSSLVVAQCFVLALCGSCPAAGDDAAGQELARMAGVWRFAVVKVGGKEQPQAGREADRMIIQKDGRYTVVQRPTITHGTIQVDATHSPKHYDILIGSGPLKGRKVPAIYEISGDTLTFCIPLGGIERPTALESTAGDRSLFEVFKRERQDVKEVLVAAGRRELTGTWQAVSYALDGKKASDEDMKKIQLVFDAEGRTRGLNDGKLFIASATNIDPTANPATIDITFSGGEKEGATALGIYKIENGLLTICRSAPGHARPADFSSNSGSGLTLMSYRREAATSK